MNRKRALLIFAGVLFLSVILFAADGRKAVIELEGGKEYTLEFGTEFEEPGCAAYTQGRIFGRGAGLKLECSGTVDCRKTGNYTLHYRTEYMGREDTAERNVTVIDTTPPLITLNYRSGYSPSWFEGYEEEGYSAFDLRDGDLTESVEVVRCPDRIIYKVSDSAGNRTELVRDSEFTRTAPIISVAGQESVYMDACPVYEDCGASACDSRGRDLTELICTEGQVIPYVPGKYEICYFIENAAGDRIEARRSVEVTASKLPEIAVPEEKTIYLTFDDGPCSNTEQLLDLLDEYDIKATFFVIGARRQYADMIGRAFRAGHTIGAHSDTHKMAWIYSDEEKYFTDLAEIEKLIYEQTGEYSALIRFPGGSRTIKSMNWGLYETVNSALNNMGYRYVDWNVSGRDTGVGKNDMEIIIENVKGGCKEKDYSVVLLHDTNGNSVRAVESIIKWGLENGYSFKPLSLTSPEVHSGYKVYDW